MAPLMEDSSGHNRALHNHGNEQGISDGPPGRTASVSCLELKPRCRNETKHKNSTTHRLSLKGMKQLLALGKEDWVRWKNGYFLPYAFALPE